MSVDAIQARDQREDEWTRRLRDLPTDDLTDDEALDRDLVLMVLRGQSLMRDWADWRRSPDHYAGPALSGVFGLMMNLLDPEPELAQAVAARWGRRPTCSQPGIDSLDAAGAPGRSCAGALGMVRRASGTPARSPAEFADHGVTPPLVAAARETRGPDLRRFRRASARWRTARLGSGRSARRVTTLLREAGPHLRRPRAAGEGDRRRTTSSPRTCVAGRGTCEEPTTSSRCSGSSTRTIPRRRRRCSRSTRRPPTRPARSASSTSWSRSRTGSAAWWRRPHRSPAPCSPSRTTWCRHHRSRRPAGTTDGVQPGHFFGPTAGRGQPEEVAARLSTQPASPGQLRCTKAYPGIAGAFAGRRGPDAGCQRRSGPLRFVFGSTYFVEGWGLTEDLLRQEGSAAPEQELCQPGHPALPRARHIVDTSAAPRGRCRSRGGRLHVDQDLAATRPRRPRCCAIAPPRRQASSHLTGAGDREDAGAGSTSRAGAHCEVPRPRSRVQGSFTDRSARRRPSFPIACSPAK